MVRIRFKRFGRHKRAFFRLCVMDQRTRRDGRVIEELGFYDPMEKDAAKGLQIKTDRIKHWLSVGAQPSETAMDFLAKNGLVETKNWEKTREWHRKDVEKKKAAAAAAAAAGEGEKKE